MTFVYTLSTCFKVLLLVLIGSFPALSLVIDGYGSSIWYLFGVMGLIALPLRIKRRQPVFPSRQPGLLLACLIGFVALSCLVYATLDPSDFSKSRLERHLLLLIAPPAFYLFWSASLRQQLLLLSFSLSGIIFFIYAMLFHGVGRLDGLVHAIHFGNTALIVMIFSLASVFLVQHPLARLMAILGTLGAATAFFDSGSRGGAVALFLSAVAVALLLTVIHGRIRYLVVAGLLLATTSLAALQFIKPVEQRYNDTLQQWENVSEGRMQNSIGKRFWMWDAAWEQVQENWLLGGGFSAYRNEIRSRIQSGELPPDMELFASEPHNQFLYQTASHGVVGLAAYLLIFMLPAFYLFRRYKQARRNDRILCTTYLMFLIAFLAFGLTITLFDQRKILQLFGLIYAMIAIYLSTPITEPKREKGGDFNPAD